MLRRGYFKNKTGDGKFNKHAIKHTKTDTSSSSRRTKYKLFMLEVHRSLPGYRQLPNSLPSQTSPLPSGRKGSAPKVRKKINSEPFWEIATVPPSPGGLRISRAFVVGQVPRLQTFLHLPSLFKACTSSVAAAA